MPDRAWAGQIIASRFKDVESRIVEDVSKVMDYYRTGTSFVKTDHLLVKLIMSMNVPLTYPLDQYYDVAIARSLQVANMLNLSSSINHGKWFDGVFYNGCPEIILAYTDEDRPQELAKGWRNLSPVKVLECPISNLWYMLPDGQKHNTERGLAVISINIPELMLMFRCFILNELRLQAEDDERPKLGIRNFIGKYVIPNMLKSQTDLAIFNRLMNLYYGAPMGDSVKRHPFRVSNYTNLLDKGLSEVLKRITDAKLKYGDVLKQVPHTFMDFPLKMPDIPETRQVYWALYLTRLREMAFLLDVSGQEGRHFNQNSLNEMRIDLRRFKNENIYQAMLPPEVYFDTQATIDRLLTLL